MIGLIGTGLMGEAIALRLLATGVPVVAWNRTPAKLEALATAGAMLAPSPAAVLQQADATVLMLADTAAIATTVFTPDTQPALAGHTLIQMGTIAPAESQHWAAMAAEAGGEYLEAPVLGSIPEAKTGQLIIMVGATAAQFAQWQPLLKRLGPEPQLIGPVGQAAALKLAMNQLIGSLTTAFAASLALVQQEGVAIDMFMTILRQSALYAPTFDKKLSRLRDHTFDQPNFPTKHLLKDLRLFVQTAEAQGLDAQFVTAVCAVTERAIALGWADADYSALITAIAPQAPT